MKFLISITLLCFPIFASAQIYKCTQSNGKVAFSDKPCPKTVTQEKIEGKQKKSDWVSRLQAEKPASITIIDVLRQDGDVIIKYEFKTKQESNDFLKLATKVSDTPVVLLKYLAPDEGRLGRAELKASNKPNSLFDNMEKARARKNKD